MSPEEAKELAAKYQALADLFAAKAAGKSLQLAWTQFSNGNGTTMWATTEYFPTIDSDLSKWRIKPEPRTWWLEMRNGRAMAVVGFDPTGMGRTYVKVQEVEP